MKTSFRNLLSKSGFTLAILVCWWLLSHYGPWPPHLFPGPEAVAASFLKMLIDGRLAKATLHSLSRMSQGYLISVAIGVPLGIMMARLRVLREAVKPVLLRVSGTLGIRGLRFYGGVLLTAALPGIVTGLKLGWSFAWRALMAGELLFISGGLGQLLNTGRELMEVPQVMAVMLAIILIGTSVDRLLFQTVELRIRRRWGLVPTDRKSVV